MSAVALTAVATALPVDVGETPLIQNLGPGAVYIDYSNTVAVGTGVEIASGTAYEFPRDLTKTLYAVSASTSDVRILKVG